MQHLTLKPLLVQGKRLATGTGDVGATLKPLLVQGKRLATDTGDLAATLNPYWFRENDGCEVERFLRRSHVTTITAPMSHSHLYMKWSSVIQRIGQELLFTVAGDVYVGSCRYCATVPWLMPGIDQNTALCASPTDRIFCLVSTSLVHSTSFCFSSEFSSNIINMPCTALQTQV